MPSSILVTTCGRPTSSSKPSRRKSSIRTLKCNSPRPETINPIPLSSTLKLTLVSSSLFKRSSICREVVNSPSLPFSGEVFGPTYIFRVGASTSKIGKASGLLSSAIVSPISALSAPVKATISPAGASLRSSLPRPLKPNKSTTLNLISELSFLIKTIDCPFLRVPRPIFPTICLPLKLSHSKLVIKICVAPSVILGDGICSTIALKIQPRSPASSGLDGTSSHAFASLPIA